MTRSVRFAFVLVFAGFYFTAAAQTASLTDAKWLLGKWANQTQRGKMVEEWTRKSDSVFNGASYMITAADSVSLESITLTKEGSDIFYIPTVKGQNSGKAVKFRLTSFTDKTLVFENPSHDFPQKISYTLVDEHSLMAEISGTVNGSERKRQFPMKRL